MTREVTYEDFLEFIKEKRKFDCIVCGNNEFNFLESSYRICLHPLITFSDVGEKTSQTEKGLFSIPYSCKNCGHMYFVSLGVVIEWMLNRK